VTAAGELPPGLALDGYRPGAIGRVAELHGTYYAAHWDFGLYFEAKVARDLSEFLLRLDPARDRFWGLYGEEGLVGSITIDGLEAQTKGAHLRWFILAPERHGQGLGHRLMAEAVGFCRDRGYTTVYLWTFAGLDAARHLYEAFGFRLAEELDAEQWGRTMREQRFVLAP
jgi:GNAT superfamily N-acetyltransferase